MAKIENTTEHQGSEPHSAENAAKDSRHRFIVFLAQHIYSGKRVEGASDEEILQAQKYIQGLCTE